MSQASDWNSRSSCARSAWLASSLLSAHCCRPVAMILKPARSSARDAAASCVTTSAQSRPSSIILMTPPIWPCARRSRLSTLAIVSLSTSIPAAPGVAHRRANHFAACSYVALLYPAGYQMLGGKWRAPMPGDAVVRSRYSRSARRLARGALRCGLGQRAGQPARDLVGYRLKLRPARQRDHDLRVERLDDGPVADGADDDVAWQQQPDAAVNAEGLVREWRTAGAEDHVILHLLAELFPQGGGEVDLGEHAKLLTGEDLADPGDRLRERRADRDAGAVAHRLAPSCMANLPRISFISSPLTAWMTFSSEAAGSAPGCENTGMPSRNAIRVGIEVIRAAADRPPWSSVSTLPNVMSGCFSLAAWKTGANIRHGPHQDAHQSMSGPEATVEPQLLITERQRVFSGQAAQGGRWTKLTAACI